MKVILLKDIPKLGKKFDIKDVKDGFALNSLIPMGSVKLATGPALKEVEAIKIKAEAEMKIQEDLLSKNIHEIDGKTVEISVKANDKGHLFAGLHHEEIVKYIKEQTRVDILPDFLEIPKSIKEVGEYVVEVKAHDKKATIKLIVSSF